jgi:hypothetical protein
VTDVTDSDEDGLSTGFRFPPEERPDLHIFLGMKNLTADEVRTGWPEGRLADLLDAAEAHLFEDQPDEAIAIWRQMIRAGGEEGDWGHLKFADYLMESDQEEEARAELRELMVGFRVSGVPWRLGADLLEDYGRLAEALIWYTAAVGSALTSEQPDRERPLWSTEVLAGRRRVRWEMDIPLDSTDLLAEISQAEAEEKLLGLDRLLSWPQVIDGKLQFRSRLDYDSLKRSVPEVSADDVRLYYRFVEHVLRQHDSGRVILLPRDADIQSPFMRAAFRARSMFELVSVTSKFEMGGAIEWPPGRNQVCWCGSGTKYKKCCGGPPATAGL